MSLFDRARIFYVRVITDNAKRANVVSSFKMRLQVNCTDPSSTCEHPLDREVASLGAVAGVCSPLDGVCICPDGYTGADTLGLYNDCHICAATMRIMDVAALVVVVISGVVALAGLLWMLHKWRVVTIGLDSPDIGSGVGVGVGGTTQTSSSPGSAAAARLSLSPAPIAEEPRRASKTALPEKKDSKLNLATREREPSLRAEDRPRKLSIVQVDFSGLRSPKTNAPSNMHKARQAEVKRRRLTLGLLVLLISFAVAAGVYQALRVSAQIRIEQTFWVSLLAIATAVNAILMALWLIIYMWWSNLPALRTFAPMFPAIKNSVLVRHPRLVERISVANSGLLVLSNLCFFFIVPMADPWLIVDSIARAAVAMLAFGLVCIVITLCSVCVGPLPFSMMRSAPNPDSRVVGNLQNKQGVDSTVNFSGSITTVRTVLAIAIVGGSLGVGTALIMILDTVAMRNYYILVPTLLFAGSLVVVVSTVIFVLRMK